MIYFLIILTIAIWIAEAHHDKPYIQLTIAYKGEDRKKLNDSWHFWSDVVNALFFIPLGVFTHGFSIAFFTFIFFVAASRWFVFDTYLAYIRKLPLNHMSNHPIHKKAAKIGITKNNILAVKVVVFLISILMYINF